MIDILAGLSFFLSSTNQIKVWDVDRRGNFVKLLNTSNQVSRNFKFRIVLLILLGPITGRIQYSADQFRKSTSGRLQISSTIHYAAWGYCNGAYKFLS